MNAIYSFVGTVYELQDDLAVRVSRVPNLTKWLFTSRDQLTWDKRFPKSDKEVSACCYWPINDFKRCTKCGEAQ